VEMPKDRSCPSRETAPLGRRFSFSELFFFFFFLSPTALLDERAWEKDNTPPPTDHPLLLRPVGLALEGVAEGPKHYDGMVQ
jgi:hypothetical protein